MLRTRVKAGWVAGVVLAVLLASLLTAVHSAELFIPPWRVHQGEPAPITLRLPVTTEVEAANATAPGAGYSWHTQKLLVPRGATPTGPLGARVEAYEAYRRPIRWPYLLGLWSIYLLNASLLFTYLRGFGKSTGRLLRTQLGLAGLLFGVALLCKGLLLFTAVPEYALPAETIPLWSVLFISRRPALLLSLVLAFMVAAFASFDVTLIAVLLARGLGSSLFFRDRKHPRSMLLAGLLGGAAGALMLLACRFYLLGGFHFVADLHRGVQSELLACVGGGLGAGLLAWVLQEPVGMALGAVSRAQLTDLCDLDQPLLKKMAQEAPGSWQHARAMANLAEDAAAAIHADAMLTRAGAYYHDLGKTIQCQYFVENLAPGERSPHEDLEPDVSADVIMSHVVGGTKILRDAGIPEPVVEFAYTHHGTSVIEYFWHKCQQQGNPKGLTDAAFRYPGMKPQTRETAILMLVDAIEAASRTIDPPERDKFEEMIQRVVFSKLRQGQLDESGLTTEDLRTLISAMADTLVKVYHHRIKYPWQKAHREAPAEATSPVPPAPAAGATGAASAADVSETSGEAEAASAAEEAVAESEPAAAQASEPAEERREPVEVVEGPRASDPPTGG